MEANLTVIQSKDFEALLNKIDEIKKSIDKLNSSKPKRYFTNKEARELLNLSSRTLQNKRDNGEIPFIQNGRKILYKFEDIENYLNSRHIKGFRK